MGTKSVTEADIAIGQRVRALRIQLKMSQTDLGDALGVTFQQVQKYERGANRIASGTMVQMAKALKTTVPELFGLNDNAAGEPARRTLMMSKSGQRLADAFNRITNQAARDALVAIAEQLARASEAMDSFREAAE